MNKERNGRMAFGLAAAVSLLVLSLSVLLTCRYYSRLSYDLLNGVCGEMLEQEVKLTGGEGQKELKKVMAAGLKAYTEGNGERTDVLPSLGYRGADFGRQAYRQSICFAAAGFLAGTLLFFTVIFHGRKRETKRIQRLTEYLEQVNTGKAVLFSSCGEDEFSKLEDEIYKTVTFLYQTRDAAVQARNEFAENLSNIAHQIKTPITAISLSVQTMEKQGGSEQIQKQLARLTRLEEALLLLSRLDAGVLSLQKEETDVFTLLVLAADNLQELLTESGTSVEIPELGEMGVALDLDWTMEVVMNLMKNCMEHDPGGIIHCAYEQNSLYTEIRIWDEGEGFDREDIPHLFERFYRGKNACGGGIGIGLALAKEIIERQKGIIRASNMPGGGACFVIRFYVG